MLDNQQIQSIPSQTNEKENSLRILSWNIKMFNSPYGWFHDRFQRSENIISVLQKMEVYDIILFQEAFSLEIRSKIFLALKHIYPNQISIDDRTSFYRENSGLWVISSIPITLIDNINFTELRNVDWFSSKGAQLYSISKNLQQFQIINTHMQADYKAKYSEVRIKQYLEIKEQLILPFENSNIPIILCGDLNISESVDLKQMLRTLNLINGPLNGALQYSSLHKKLELLDYILVKTKLFKFQSISRQIYDISRYLKIDAMQLSDHYPIEGIFIW